ncbi:MAG: hypothetical protein ACKOSO_09335 [Actinomycetota bacterium]
MPGASGGAEAGRGVALRAHARARWQHALRFGLVVGAPLAAGVAAGARPQGAIGAAAAFLVVLHGPPATPTIRLIAATSARRAIP